MVTFTFMMNLKTWLKQEKGARGLTQEQFAKQIGISRVHLQRLLSSGRASDKLKIRIQRATGESVRIASWFETIATE